MNDKSNIDKNNNKLFIIIIQVCLGSKTWAMKVANLQSLERMERMIVRWMCGVSLKDRKHSVDLYSLLGVQSVVDVVRYGSLRWFGHLESRSVDD